MDVYTISVSPNEGEDIPWYEATNDTVEVVKNLLNTVAHDHPLTGEITMNISDLEGKPLDVEAYGKRWMLVFELGIYHNGRPALTLLDEYSGEPFGVLTCNIPEIPLTEKEIIVKTWSENEQLAYTAMKSGYFKDTGKRVPTGFVEAQIWEVV